MTDMHSSSRAKEQRQAEARVKDAGYAHSGSVHSDYESSSDAKADKKRVRKAMGEHDQQLHPGRHTKLTGLRNGGHVDGEKAHRRIDRRARGGGLGVPGTKPHTPHAKAKGKTHLTINIHNSNPGERQQAAQKGMQQGMRMGAAMGARQAAQKMARPPAPPPGGGMPPGGAPPRPPMAPPGGGGMPPMGMGGAAAPGATMPRPPGAPPFADGGHVKVKGHWRRKAGERV